MSSTEIAPGPAVPASAPAPARPAGASAASPPAQGPSIFGEDPASVRRLVLLLYALVAPPFTAIIYLVADPPVRTAATVAVAVLCVLGPASVVLRRLPGTRDWILPTALVPSLACGIGYAASTRAGPVFLAVAAAPVVVDAILFEAPVAWTAWATSVAAVALGMGAREGPEVGAAGGAVFAVMIGFAAWAARGKAAALRGARAALEAKTARLEALLEVLPDALVVGDAEGRFKEILGPADIPLPLPREQLVGRSAMEFLPPPAAAALREAIAASLAGKAASKVEYEVRYPDGLHRFELRTVRSGPGEVLAVRRETTAEREVEAQRRLVAAIVEGMAEAVTIVDLDGRVRSWSPGAELIYGWPAAEALGRHLAELVGPELSRAELEAGMRRIAAEGRFTTTGQRRRKDGTTITVEAALTLMRDPAGRPDGILGVARDVTAAVEARSRELADARLRGLDERLNDVELVVGEDGRMVHVNDRALALYGYAREELLGLRLADLRAPETLGDLEQRILETNAAAAGTRFETVHRRKDGRTFPVEASVRIFRLGGVPYMHGLVRDLTAQRAAEAGLAAALQDARRAVQQRDRVVAVVAHDLRTSLHAIELTAFGLETDPSGERSGAGVPERAALVRSVIERMRHLVNDLVDSAVIERGALRLVLAEEDLVAIAGEALRLARPVADRAGVSLALAAPLAARARCDRKRVLQALGNLLGNALAATPAGGAVTLRVSPAAGGVELVVEDTGPGLPENVERLFEPFERGPGVTYSGAGLGLGIARGIATGHGGTLRALPAPGGGAALHLRLPDRPPASSEWQPG